MRTRICILVGGGTASLIIGIILIMAVEADQNPDVPVFVEMVEEESSLLKHAPDDLIVIPSRQVMEHVLQHVPFNPLEWLDEERRKEILAVKLKKRKQRKT